MSGRAWGRSVPEEPPLDAGTEAPSSGRQVPRIAVWTLAVALAVLAGALLWSGRLQAEKAELAPKTEAYDRVIRVLMSPDLVTVELVPATPGSPARGTLHLAPAAGAGIVTVRRFPTPAPGRTWQLSFAGEAGRISGGVVTVDPSGSGYATVAVPANLAGVDEVGIAEGRAGGPPAPATSWAVRARIKD